MPQMSPLNWALLFLFLVLTTLVIINNMPKIKIQNHKHMILKMKENKMKW